MKSILSIQSHVAYGYVGNKAATYPLQAMGFDVWPINTVQFSNHTGYPGWRGQVFSAEHIVDLVCGIFELGKAGRCQGILSGYMGSSAICYAVRSIVHKFKKLNSSVVYLCDPVIGDGCCYVRPEVLAFFQHHLRADIITPNQYEAEFLSGITIKHVEDLHKVSKYFHGLGVSIVIITGIRLEGDDGHLNVFASNGSSHYLIKTDEYKSNATINGTGDLFSSTFLGAYLKDNNIPAALQYAVSCLQSAVRATVASGTGELQVLSVNYRDPAETLPEVISL
ncbi:pyridoxal kinase [Rickettsiales endosymbiont of Peranema trichophorum]|uniref:pyridoxal kinase n=1 Tax=Rickettsiales endosymbiont of Peranema trichophorum TaxID=2486577 RepID=UPI001023C548|nr:pyridoxal kinase [Rickettsiales endosymbiont of Peranema trichophorum]RZI45159.1 pyridoxal kinase [Rickettsiales endosymbiont of Peranema trichophorum]